MALKHLRTDGLFCHPNVNNEPQARMINKRKNIRQGYSISTCLYNYGADALLNIALSKRLKGVEYFKCSTFGPHHPVLGKPQPVSDSLRVLGFVDDCKAVLTSVQDFLTLDATIKTFEKSTGSQLHRDPGSKKCQALPYVKPLVIKTYHQKNEKIFLNRLQVSTIHL